MNMRLLSRTRFKERLREDLMGLHQSSERFGGVYP
jgi:hypothetical protein